MSAEHHDTGKAFLPNLAPNVSPAFEPVVQTGRAVELGATNDLVIPTHVDGYITYHNLGTNTITQEATDGTDKTFNTITINNILTAKNPLDATSLANIQAEPNLLAELGINGSAVGVNITLDTDDSYYAVSEESGADVFDARVAGNDATITSYAETIRTNANNQSTGLQTTVLELDASGVPTAYNSTANTAMVYDDTIINTGFKPNIARYSIEETITGELQDFGADSKQSATIPAGVVESPSHLYTCTTAIGDITALSAETSGNIKINYTLSSTTAGSAGTNTTDGTYEDVIAFDAGITLAGYTGVVTVNSVNGLSTKTQRTETRLLTHDEAVLGDNQTNGLIASNSSGNFTITDLTGGVFNCVDTGSTRFDIFRLKTLNNLLSKNIRIAFDCVINSGSCEIERAYNGYGGLVSIWQTLVDGNNVLDSAVGSQNATDIYLYTADAQVFDITISNIVIQEVSTENLYYIDTALQTVTPPLPSSTTAIDLNDTPIIGYADTIERRDSKFRVLSTVVTFEELAALNNIDILASGVEILTDEKGVYLTNEFGEYLTI